MIKRKIGSILFFSGFLLLIYTGYNYLEASGNFNFLGLDIVASKEDVTPLLISAAVMLLGIIISSSRR
ncbi:MAG: hypothetical protein R3224_04060 [Balneolaceae bacterium]|nr:hypothetical protein [Balneolaceae bacterium]